MPSKNQTSNSLTYVAQTPSFLRNFGQAPVSPPPSRRGGGGDGSGDGRAALPERPREGRWAGGSDKGDDSDEDEWGERFGGGGEDGPQVVVLKEGRHLTGEEVKRERRKAQGKPSVSPPPPTTTSTTKAGVTTTTIASTNGGSALGKPAIPKKPNTSKRKLVGGEDGEATATATATSTAKAGGGEAGAAQKKKKKAKKGMLSFNEAEGEE